MNHYNIWTYPRENIICCCISHLPIYSLYFYSSTEGRMAETS